MECSKCGAELVEGAPFCGNCGASSNASRVGKQTKKKARVAAVVVLAVVLGLGAIAGLMAVTDGGQKDIGDGYEITCRALQRGSETDYVFLKGAVKNTSGSYADISVMYEFLDADGNSIALAADELENIPAGESREFEILLVPLNDSSLFDDPNRLISLCKSRELVYCSVD